MPLPPIHIVWFKKDLRVHDHAPLFNACQAGHVLPIYCWEPSIVLADDYAMQHQQFARECLLSLKAQLQNLGLSLVEFPNGIVDALNTLAKHYQIAGIYSHQETGNDVSYKIDIAVGKWCQYNQVDWQEFTQNGAVRRLNNRNHWNSIWEQRMALPQIQTPTSALSVKPPAALLSQPMLIPQATGLDKPARQHGGRTQALNLLNSFLEQRASRYRGGISSPLNAITACSRISPYLAFGCISMREVVQRTREQRAYLNDSLATNNSAHQQRLIAGLAAFESRLHWHCHFIQKLETEPALEFNHLHHAYNGIHEQHLSEIESQKRLNAWTRGETGWPLIDACMAMLRQTGWINFRMRAMLMSTASYLYWLHWRQPGLHLAREFLDYEPGIHWPQVQMQSGTTGINTLRIYSPVKQAKDQDPRGAFVRHWLPALKHVPDTWIFEPYLMPKALQLQYGCELEKHYPLPIVDITVAARHAKQCIAQARQKQGAYEESQAIIKKHASRKGMLGSQRDQHGQPVTRKKTNKTPQNPQQKTLF